MLNIVSSIVVVIVKRLEPEARRYINVQISIIMHREREREREGEGKKGGYRYHLILDSKTAQSSLCVSHVCVCVFEIMIGSLL